MFKEFRGLYLSGNQLNMLPDEIGELKEVLGSVEICE